MNIEVKINLMNFNGVKKLIKKHSNIINTKSIKRK